jgi:uncharacterized protein YcfL
MRKTVLLTLALLSVSACSAKQEKPTELSYKERSKIVMQRVKDTTPLAKQDLVSREAMQYAMLDKMNVREERQRREFNRIQEQQREDFLLAQQSNINEMQSMRDNIETSHEKLIESDQEQNRVMSSAVARFEELTNQFIMTASEVQDNSQMQAKYFNDMKDSYENKLAFEEAKLARERERENTIRGVVENMYADQDTALTQFYSATKEGMLPPSQWVNLEDAKVTLHVEDERFEDLMLRAVNNAGVHAGPWQLKWKLKKENELLLYTKFSLDAETTFGEFINNVRQYIVNYNGVRLNFRVFKEKRVLIVSDS